jgi:hypothetical protein
MVALIGGGDPLQPSAGPVLRALFLIVLTAAMLVASPRHRRLSLTIVGTAILLLAVTTMINGYTQSRYVAAASLLVLSAIGVGLGGAQRGVLVGLASALMVGSLTTLAAHPYRVSGTSWAESVQRWSVSCGSGASTAPLATSPSGWPFIQMACPSHT